MLIALRSRDAESINWKMKVLFASDYSNLPPNCGPFRARSIDNRTIDAELYNDEEFAFKIRSNYSVCVYLCSISRGYVFSPLRAAHNDARSTWCRSLYDHVTWC